eukprot:2465502-Pyramimonas_sp.AAC.1
MSVDVKQITIDTLEFPNIASGLEKVGDQLVFRKFRENEVVRGGSQNIFQIAWKHERGLEGGPKESHTAGIKRQGLLIRPHKEKEEERRRSGLSARCYYRLEVVA